MIPATPSILIVTRAVDVPTRAPVRVRPPPVDYGKRFGAARGLYRVFNAACYRIYASTSAPPTAGSGWTATSTTLPANVTLADGTWYVSVSHFDGVLDSGFYPVGPQGQTYITVVISGGAMQPTPSTQPQGVTLTQTNGGVPLLQAWYSPVADAANRATSWAIAYTTDGSTPATGSPTTTVAMGAAGLQRLRYFLPAQANGTVVKAQLQVSRASGPTVYSTPISPLSLTVSTTGPSTPIAAAGWPGPIPEGN